MCKLHILYDSEHPYITVTDSKWIRDELNDSIDVIFIEEKDWSIASSAISIIAGSRRHFRLVFSWQNELQVLFMRLLKTLNVQIYRQRESLRENAKESRIEWTRNNGSNTIYYKELYTVSAIEPSSPITQWFMNYDNMKPTYIGL